MKERKDLVPSLEVTIWMHSHNRCGSYMCEDDVGCGDGCT